LRNAVRPSGVPGHPGASRRGAAGRSAESAPRAADAARRPAAGGGPGGARGVARTLLRQLQWQRGERRLAGHDVRHEVEEDDTLGGH